MKALTALMAVYLILSLWIAGVVVDGYIKKNPAPDTTQATECLETYKRADSILRGGKFENFEQCREVIKVVNRWEYSWGRGCMWQYTDSIKI